MPPAIIIEEWCQPFGCQAHSLSARCGPAAGTRLVCTQVWKPAAKDVWPGCAGGAGAEAGTAPLSAVSSTGMAHVSRLHQESASRYVSDPIDAARRQSSDQREARYILLVIDMANVGHIVRRSAERPASRHFDGIHTAPMGSCGTNSQPSPGRCTHPSRLAPAVGRPRGSLCRPLRRCCGLLSCRSNSTISSGTYSPAITSALCSTFPHAQIDLLSIDCRMA